MGYIQTKKLPPCNSQQTEAIAVVCNVTCYLTLLRSKSTLNTYTASSTRVASVFPQKKQFPAVNKAKESWVQSLPIVWTEDELGEFCLFLPQ